MTSISCRCGAVELKFTSTSPRVTTECCCNHCFQRIKYLEERGGPQISLDLPLTNSKWDNWVQIQRGRDQLFVYRMTSSTLVTNIATKCCYTFLLGRQPLYDANCVTTCDECPVFDQHYEPVAPSSRWFVNQWPKERAEKLQPLIGMWVDDNGQVTGQEGWESVFEAQIARMKRPKNEDVLSEGETFDDIVDCLQKENIIIA